jgi:hypothetical protein
VIKSLGMFSQSNGKVVKWNLACAQETDEGGNTNAVIIAKHADEIHRFSPNTTDDELHARATMINEEAAA